MTTARRNHRRRTPILLHGSLHCPYCKVPLIIEELGDSKYRCVYCGGFVGKLTDEIIIEMAREIPIETFREWNRELT
jgi:hypothetical protein